MFYRNNKKYLRIREYQEIFAPIEVAKPHPVGANDHIGPHTAPQKSLPPRGRWPDEVGSDEEHGRKPNN